MTHIQAEKPVRSVSTTSRSAHEDHDGMEGERAPVHLRRKILSTMTSFGT